MLIEWPILRVGAGVLYFGQYGLQKDKPIKAAECRGGIVTENAKTFSEFKERSDAEFLRFSSFTFSKANNFP